MIAFSITLCQLLDRMEPMDHKVTVSIAFTKVMEPMDHKITVSIAFTKVTELGLGTAPSYMFKIISMST